MKKIDGWVTAPQGFLAAGVKAGIKASGNHDVAVIYSTVPASTGAVFTQNKMCAAPVLLSREVAQEAVAQAIIVNSVQVNRAYLMPEKCRLLQLIYLVLNRRMFMFAVLVL